MIMAFLKVYVYNIMVQIYCIRHFLFINNKMWLKDLWLVLEFVLIFLKMTVQAVVAFCRCHPGWMRHNSLMIITSVLFFTANNILACPSLISWLRSLYQRLRVQRIQRRRQDLHQQKPKYTSDTNGENHNGTQ